MQLEVLFHPQLMAIGGIVFFYVLVKSLVELIP